MSSSRPLRGRLVPSRLLMESCRYESSSRGLDGAGAPGGVEAGVQAIAGGCGAVRSVAPTSPSVHRRPDDEAHTQDHTQAHTRPRHPLIRHFNLLRACSSTPPGAIGRIRKGVTHRLCRPRERVQHLSCPRSASDRAATLARGPRPITQGHPEVTPSSKRGRSEIAPRALRHREPRRCDRRDISPRCEAISRPETATAWQRARAGLGTSDATLPLRPKGAST